MAQLPVARSRESSYRQHHSCKYCDYHQSGRCNRNDCRSDYHHQDDLHHNHPQRDDKDSKCSKSYNKKDNCRCNHFKEKSNKAMHNDQSSLSSAGNLSGRRSWSCSRSPSCSWSCSCPSSRSYDNHHVDQDDCKPSAAPKHGYLYSEDNNDGHYNRPDKRDTVFATFSAPKAKKKRTKK